MRASMKIAVVFSAVTSLLATAAHAETSTRARELFAIWDFETAASKNEVVKAALDGMRVNISRSDTMTPVVLDEPPEKAARFKIVDALAGSPLAGFMGMVPEAQRMKLKRATCEGAIWVAEAERNIEGMHNLRMTMCLFPRRGGYALDVWALDVQERGGGLSSIIGRAVSNKIVGGPDQWVNKTFFDIVRSIRKRADAKVTYVDGSLEFEGEPWMEHGMLTAAEEQARTH